MILIYSPHITKADGMDSQDINIVDDMLPEVPRLQQDVLHFRRCLLQV